MNIVWLVTHGETVLRRAGPDGAWMPDPGMSESGFQEVAQLKTVLDENLAGEFVPQVQCGVGRRQREVSRALGFNNSDIIFFSSLWGDASTLAGKDKEGVKWVLLSYGELIRYDHYLSVHHASRKVVRGAITALPNNTVICSGRPVLLRLGMELERCHNGALYALHVQDNGKVLIRLVQQGKFLPS